MNPSQEQTGVAGGALVQHPIVPVIKEFRKEIDASIQKAVHLLSAPDSAPSFGRELSLVRTKLEEAKMWAGKVLEAVGNPFPPELADKAEAR